MLHLTGLLRGGLVRVPRRFLLLTSVMLVLALALAAAGCDRSGDPGAGAPGNGVAGEVQSTLPPRPPGPAPVLTSAQVGSLLEFIDVTGVWRAAQHPHMPLICEPMWRGGHNSCFNSYVWHRDWLFLRAVDMTIGERTFFGEEQDLVVEVRLEGEYHHFHSFYSRIEEGPDSSWWPTRLQGPVEEHVYALEGTVQYFLGKGPIRLELDGRLADPPRHNHPGAIKIYGTTGFEYYGPCDPVVGRTAVRSPRGARPAERPPAGGYGFIVEFIDILAGPAGRAPEGMFPSLDRGGYDPCGRLAHVIQIWPFQFLRLINDGQPLDARGPITGEVEGWGEVGSGQGTVELYDAQDLTTAVRETDLREDGTFGFDDLPLFVTDASTDAGLRRARYVVRIGNARFARHDGDEVHYLEPVQSASLVAPDHVVLQATEVFMLGSKLRLAEALSAIGQIHYAPIEARVPPWLDGLAAGELDGLSQERVLRAIDAEAVMLAGARAADSTIQTTLEALGHLFSALYGDLLNARSRGMERSRRAQSELQAREARNEELAARFNLPPGGDTASGQLLRDAAQMAVTAELTDKVASLIKTLRFFLFERIIPLVGGDAPRANAFAQQFEQGLTVLADLVKNRTLAGGATSLIQQAIKDGVNALHTIMLDNRLEAELAGFGALDFRHHGFVESFPSYTGSTAELLAWSLDRAMGWESEDWDRYIAHSDAANAIARTINQESTDVKVRNIWLQALRDSAGQSASVLGTLGKVVRQAKAAGTVAKGAAYLFNAEALVDSLVYAFFRNPELVEAGVYAAFGEEPPEGGFFGAVPGPDGATAAHAPAAAEHGGSPPVVLPVTSHAGAEGETTAFDGATALGLGNQVRAAERELSQRLLAVWHALQADDIGTAMLLTAGDEGPTLRRALEDWGDLTSAVLALAASLDPATAHGIYSDFGRRLARAQERHLELEAQLVEVAELLWELYAEVVLEAYEDTDDPVYIALRNRAQQQLSAASERVTRGGAVGDLAFLLNRAGFTTYPAVQVRLEPPRSDATGDEVVTQAEETFTVRARVRNISTVPVEGLTARLSVVSPDGSVTLVTDANAAVPALAAAAFDPFAPAEVEVAWDVRYAGDLVEGAAVLVVDLLQEGAPPAGIVTFQATELLLVDPLLATPAPPDPAAGEPMTDGEPRLAVDRTEVVLTPDAPVAAVMVTNDGTGALYWTAAAENETLAVTSPEYPQVRGEGLLFITVPGGFSFEATRPAETVVRVADLSGVNPEIDVVEIRVRVVP